MKRKLSLLCLLLVFGAAMRLAAQDRTITGSITSADDRSPLPGVSVVVRGTTVGTATDAEGKYSISAPASATLVFSFIGMQTQEIAVGNRTTVDVQMASDVRQLNEVIVTAQGIERSKNELPYAAQKVGGEEVSRSRDNNFVNALSGKVSGLQVNRNNNLGGSTNVVIRGVKSLTGNNQALFVVDGVPIDNSNTNSADQATGRGGYDYGNAAADINPDDIESVNVLKGAAATALYGSRAANGVILITTKKGGKGLGITLNSGVTLGYVNKNTFPTYQKQYGAGYGRYYGPEENAFFNEFDPNGDGRPDLVVPMGEDASHGGAFDPSLQVYQWSSFDPTSPYYNQPRPWVAGANDPTTFFQNPVQTINSVMIDNGSDRGFFKLGYTRNVEEGILPNSKLNKDFVNFGASYNITKQLTAGASVNVTNVTGRGRYGTGYDGAGGRNLMTNFRQWWQTNVDIKELEDAYNRTGQNVTWNRKSPTNPAPAYWDNPYWTRSQNLQNDNRLRYFGNINLNYKVTEWLNLLGRVSLDRYDELQEERIAVGSVGVSEYQRFNRTFQEFNYDLLANFNKNISDAFVLRGVLGTNIRKTRVESIFAETNGGLVIPGLYTLSNSQSPLVAPYEQDSVLQVNGIFASATLGYRNFLFLDLAGRRDEASSLPKGNNVYYYPSISTSFVFAELLKNQLPWLAAGKVRLNYAEVGNTAPAYILLDTYDKPAPFGTTPLLSAQGTRSNPNLRPERTRSYEAGLEMSFFDARFGFDFTYYNSESVDQIIPLSISRATGSNRRYINAGTIRNRGVELSAFVMPIRTPAFSWTVNANWTRNRNEVVALTEGVANIELANFQGGVSINAALGQPYGVIRGGNFVFSENGQRIVGANGLYRQSANTNEVIGNINPDWTGGVSNTFKYKDLALSFLLDVRKGGDIFSLDMYYGLATGLYPETAGTNDLGNPVRSPISEGGGVILEGVKEDGTPNDTRISAVNFGVYGYRRNPAGGFVYDASYVKLRELALTYSLPNSLIGGLKALKGIDLSIVGRNLAILHKNLPYADPEDGLGSGNYQQGYQVGSYPTTRNIGFNIRARF